MRMAGPRTRGDVSRPPFIDDHFPVIVEHRRNIRGRHVVVRVKTVRPCNFNINVSVVNNKEMAMRGNG